MIKILAWLLLILFLPLIIIIGSLIGIFMYIKTIFCVYIHEINCEMERIFDYQIIPYIKWKIKNFRERFRKKDSN